jgi:hypothetical protein
MNWMCFDLRYQKLVPEVKTAIDVFLSTAGSSDLEILKRRIAPFLGIK